MLHSIPVYACVDTGSCITFISRTFYDRLPNAPPLKPSNVTPLSVTGEPLQIDGVADLQYVLFPGNCFTYSTLVAQNTDENVSCLLGIDFMINNGLDINFANKTLKCNNVEIPCIFPNTPGNVTSTEKCETKTKMYSVKANETVIVPERSEVVLVGRISIDDRDTLLESDKEGIVYPSQKFQERYNLCSARVLASVNNCGDSFYVPVRIANFQPVPIKVYRSSDIGMYGPELVTNIKNSDCKSETKNIVSTLYDDVDNFDSKFDSCIDRDSLDLKQRETVHQLLCEYNDIFAFSMEQLGRTDIVHHSIDTGTSQPIHQNPYRIPFAQRETVKAQIDQMLANDVIRPSCSPWASPVVVVKKKNGEDRFCVDYRRLNAVSKKDVYPLPRVDETLDLLGGAKYFTTLDFRAGYWQLEVRPEDREKTAFTTPFGLFEFNVLPFGLSSAPASYQRLMSILLSGLQWRTCLIYLDDVLVISKTFDEHILRLREIFDRLRSANLKLNPDKCHFCKPSVLYLGHVVTPEGIKPDPQKLVAIKDYPRPSSVTDVRAFIGLASYYRRFVREFARLAAPLHKLQRKNITFIWTKECELSFQSLKSSLATAPILPYPDFTKEFQLETDASDLGIGCVLSQDGHVISYASRTLNRHEKNYSTIEKECLAVVWSIKYHRPYLYGRRFCVISDHKPLQWLKNLKDPVGRLARWALTIQEYDFNITHRSGSSNGNADGLSRGPVQMPSCIEVDEVPTFMVNKDNQVKDQDMLLSSKDSESKGIASYQKLDTDLKAIIDKLQDSDSKDTKESFVLISNTLYHVTEEDQNGVQKFCIVVPKDLKKEVMFACHDELVAGHLGFEKTYAKIKSRYYWSGMRQDIMNYCKTCPDCQTRKKPTNLGRAPMMPLPAVDLPFERVAIDVLGPLPQTERGNKFIVVCTDYLTRWTEAFAVPNATADTIAELFVEQILCRHGAPNVLLSDQGSNFLSNLVKEVCTLLGTSRVRTSPYHPQTDGLVERMNKTLANMMAMYVNERHDDWDRFLPFALFAYRTSVQSLVKETPFFLLYGRYARLPLDVTLRTPYYRLLADMGDYKDFVTLMLPRARALAKNNLVEAQQRQKKSYDKVSKKVHDFNIGDNVYVHNPSLKKGLSPKFQHAWHGPFKIQHFTSPVNVQLLDSNGKSQVVHVNRLKPAHVRQSSIHSEYDSDDEWSTDDDIPLAQLPR